MADPLKLLQECALGKRELRELTHVFIYYKLFCVKLIFRIINYIMFLVMLHTHMMQKQILVFIISLMNIIQLNQYYIYGKVAIFSTLLMLKTYQAKVFNLLHVCKGIFLKKINSKYLF